MQLMITLLHVSQMMLYALDHELFQAFSRLFSSCPSGRLNLNFSRPKNAFPEELWLLALFAACGEASVFALVKSSLDCRHVCLLESVLLLAGCCERVFLHHGEDSPIIHHCCHPWTSRSFYVAELTSSVFFSQNVPNCWFGHSECSSYLSDGSEQQLPNANGALKSTPELYLLNWCRNNEGIAHGCPWNSFWVNCPITYGPLKKGGGGGGVHIKEL